MSRRLIINGGRQPRELVLVGRMVVGRDPACDVSEADPLLSRRHAEFVAGARDVIVRDLGSRNGILVNGVKQPQAVLHGGDVVQVGHLRVRFEDEPGPHLDQTMAGPDPAASMPTKISSAVTPPRPADGPGPTGTQRIDPPSSSDFAPTAKMPPTPLPGPNGSGSSHGSLAAETTEVFFGPGNRICFEKPVRGWRLVPGGTAAIVSMAHESGLAAVVVERAAIVPLAKGEATQALADREADEILSHDPGATSLEATVATIGARRMAVITYARMGVAGAERVRQYSIPAGGALYRLTCSAHEAEFARFDPVFAHVAATFATGT